MQEKIIDEMKHWGEEIDYTQDNLDAYETFKLRIDDIANMSNPEDFTKEDILELLKEELKELEEELR